MWRTIPVALICWLTLLVSSRGQDVFVPRELKTKSAAKPDKGEALQTEKTAPAKEPVASKPGTTQSARTKPITEPPAGLHPEKTQPVSPAGKTPFVIPHSEKSQTMKFEPVKPLSGKEPSAEAHPEKVPPQKIESAKVPVVKEPGANLHPEKVQSTKVEPEKVPASSEPTANPRTKKVQTAKTESVKVPAAKETAKNSRSEKAKSAKVELEKAPATKEPKASPRTEKVQSAKIEPVKVPAVKETAKNSRSEKAKSAKVEPEKVPASNEPTANPRTEKVQTAKVEAAKVPAVKGTAAKSRSELVKTPAVKEQIVNLRPEKTQMDKAELTKPAAPQEPTVDVQLSDRSMETGSTKLADGFDFPVGKPEAEGYYKARGFRSGGHMGEDWDGIRGGDTDLKDPIYCIGNGIVVFARDVHKGWGNVVIVRHAFREGGMVKHVDSLYGHLHSIMVKRGQRMARGQQIGTMGTAHGQYDAHLHLEIRKNLEIGMSRAKFAKNFSNYYDPSQFIESHRRLTGGGANFRVAMNTFTHDSAFHFDDAPNYSPRKRSTAQSAAALKQALSGPR